MANKGFGRRMRNNIMNWVLGQTPATAPAAWYISAHTADPLDDGSAAAANEATGGSYARVQVLVAGWSVTLTNTPPPPANDASSIVNNLAVVSFPVSSGAWSAGANLTYYALWDHPTLQTEARFIGRWPATGTIQAVTAATQQITFPIAAFAPSATVSP